MTIGIGAVCDHGRYVLLASDTRASYGLRSKTSQALVANDEAGKQFDFHPLRLVASVAGQLSLIHEIIGEMTVQFDKLISLQKHGKALYRERVENAIDDARFRQLKRLYRWAAKANYGLSLNQLLTGKLPHGEMHPVVWEDIKQKVYSLPFPVEIIVGGYLEDEPVLFKATEKKAIVGGG